MSAPPITTLNLFMVGARGGLSGGVQAIQFAIPGPTLRTRSGVQPGDITRWPPPGDDARAGRAGGGGTGGEGSTAPGGSALNELDEAIARVLPWATVEREFNPLADTPEYRSRVLVAITREKALNLAAWLVAIASVGDYARPGEEFTTDEQFAELLERIRAT